MLMGLLASLLLLAWLPGCSQDDDDMHSVVDDDDDDTGDDDDDDTVDDDDSADDDDDTSVPVNLSADPTEVAFGLVDVYGMHESSFTLIEAGVAEVNITGGVVSGAGAGAFLVDDLEGTVLPLGESIEVTVTYVPTDATTHYAEVIVYSDANPSLLTVLLSGTGQMDPDAIDNDGDGQSENEGDCDDYNADVWLGAPELCNGTDDSCDGIVPADETTDVDGDGALACEDCDDNDAALNLQDNDWDAWSTCDGDCDDNDSSVRPGAQEGCNGVDDDCDGVVPADETTDADGDGDLACQDCDDNDAAMNNADADGDLATTCNGDCDDNDPSIYPGAIDTPNDGIDSDCDGSD